MDLKKTGALVLVYIFVGAIFLSAAYWGSVAVSVLADTIPIEREAVIIIDPGHGGEDGGATSCSGVLESNINLEISLRLRDVFHLLGYKTVMTRTTDRSLAVRGQTIASRKNADLKARTALVNGTEDAILISIHQNIFPESQYRGAQVFYAPEGEGAALAERLQSAFAATVNPGSNRKCKKAEGIYLMRHINCTGILVECGFLSNPEEELMLRTADYQKKICAVIAATTAEFLTK